MKAFYHIIITFIIVVAATSFKPVNTTMLSAESTVIVVPDKADYLEKESAARLSKWLRKIYNADTGFNIIKQSLLSAQAGEIIIAVGNTKFVSSNDVKNLKPYGFTIEKANNVVTIQGANSLATLIGTGYFLDKFCGVRFYLPGDLFTSVPSKKVIELSNTISITQTPATKYVFSTGYKNNDEFYWARINGLIRKDWGAHEHTMGDRFFNDTIIKSFPEIFPTYNGKKYFPTSRTDQKWQPDFAEPNLVNAALLSAVQYFKLHPDMDYISFSVQDSKNYPTEGKMGEFLKNYPQTSSGFERGYTDAYIKFLNQLALKLPAELAKNGITTQKTIVYIAYQNVKDLPTEKLNPNILPVTVFQIARSLMDSLYNTNNINENIAHFRLSEWAKVTTRIGNHDWAEGKGFIYPRIYTNLVSKFVKNIKDDKMQLEFAHLEVYPNWALDGPKYYFMGKLYWNPDVNSDSLLTLFCADMFGKASDKMKNYFTTLEDLNTSMNNDINNKRNINVYTSQLSLNKNQLAMVQQARKLLNDAASFAETDLQKQRIDFFSKGFKISEYFFSIYNSATADINTATELKNYLQQSVQGYSQILNAATDSNFITKMNGVIDGIIKVKSKRVN